MQKTQQTFVSTKGRHLTSLPGSDWKLWRWVALRSAGFPVHGVLKLAAAPELISAVDAVVQAKQGIESALEKARQEINYSLDELKAAGQWNNKQKRRTLLKALKRVRGGNLPENGNAQFTSANQEMKEAHAKYLNTFKGYQTRLLETIREIARPAAFREAVMWQNPAALQNVMEPLLTQSGDGSTGGFAQRRRVETVASYWQRFCTKNDTIGFFGPIGWAQIATDLKHIAVSPGPKLISYRKVYWEQWPIQAIGSVIAAMEGVQPWIKPFLIPYMRLQGKILYHPQLGSLHMTDQDAALLRDRKSTRLNSSHMSI